MEKISVEEKEKSDNGWVFAVRVGEEGESTEHKVTLPKDYYDTLTRGWLTPEELVRQSFEFLLARESKESILREFELPVIQKYFPEYEGEMQKKFQNKKL